jgi:branched-chain amino acid transport system substrate-binding protein
MKRAIYSIIGLLYFLLTFSGCSSTSGHRKVVTFGAILPLTGDVSNWGHDSSEGIRLAIEAANRGSTSYEYRVIFEDSKGSGAEAVAAARKLITVDKVSAIIGDNISGPTVAMVPIVNDAKVPLISPSASTPKLTGMSPYFFRVYPSDTAEGSYMAEIAATRLHAKSIGILFINNDFGIGLRDVFSNTFKAKGGTILAALPYNSDETNFRPYIAQMRSQHPDAIYLAGYYQDGGSIMKQAKEMGLSVPILGSTTHEDPRLLTIAGDAAEGFLYPFSTGYDAQSSSQAVLKFNDSFTSKYRKSPGLVAALGYDCAVLLVTAVEKENPSPESIRSFLAKTHGFEGASGVMDFDANGDVHKPIRLKTVRNGKFVFLDAVALQAH